jgi:hypothetical protein
MTSVLCVFRFCLDDNSVSDNEIEDEDEDDDELDASNDEDQEDDQNVEQLNSSIQSDHGSLDESANSVNGKRQNTTSKKKKKKSKKSSKSKHSIGGYPGNSLLQINSHQSYHHHSSSSSKPARIRTVLNEKQLQTLRACYGANPRPDALMKEQLVEMTGLNPRVIRVWFQNKRCKDKKKNMLVVRPEHSLQHLTQYHHALNSNNGSHLVPHPFNSSNTTNQPNLMFENSCY